MLDIGATSFESYTNFTKRIIDSINVTSTEECCNYKKQILDKLCARQVCIYNTVVYEL